MYVSGSGPALTVLATRHGAALDTYRNDLSVPAQQLAGTTVRVCGRGGADQPSTSVTASVTV